MGREARVNLLGLEIASETANWYFHRNTLAMSRWAFVRNPGGIKS